jgi:hypothetical protein
MSVFRRALRTLTAVVGPALIACSAAPAASNGSRDTTSTEALGSTGRTGGDLSMCALNVRVINPNAAVLRYARMQQIFWGPTWFGDPLTTKLDAAFARVAGGPEIYRPLAEYAIGARTIGQQSRALWAGARLARVRDDGERKRHLERLVATR